jgi:voltage-gated potassium channel
MNEDDQPDVNTSFTRSLLREAFSREIRNLFFIVTGFVVVGTIVYRSIEGWGWVDSFYFSVMTLTTVGYGDLAPETSTGKIFTTFFVFGGLGIVLTFLQTIAREQAKEPFFFRIANRHRNKKD